MIAEKHCVSQITKHPTELLAVLDELTLLLSIGFREKEIKPEDIPIFKFLYCNEYLIVCELHQMMQILFK